MRIQSRTEDTEEHFFFFLTVADTFIEMEKVLLIDVLVSLIKYWSKTTVSTLFAYLTSFRLANPYC